MFFSERRATGAAGDVDVVFTDRRGGVSAPPFDSLNLGSAGIGGTAEMEANLRVVADALHVERIVTMRQVHGRDVAVVADPGEAHTCDAMVTDLRDVALCVRVADCVPVLLADAGAGVIGAVHAGRGGVAGGVALEAVASMRRLGATAVTGWIGPHVCGGCYEVPDDMRREVAEVVPAAYACTTWGTPSLDLGAGVAAQLTDAGCEVVDVAACTRERPDLYSYRRDGASAGRFAGLVVLRGASDV
jgi:YfiH family protein